MTARGEGVIAVTGATAALRGKPMTVGFATAKAAQRMLTQSLARDLGPKGIHCFYVIVDGGIGRQSGDQGQNGSGCDRGRLLARRQPAQEQLDSGTGLSPLGGELVEFLFFLLKPEPLTIYKDRPVLFPHPLISQY